MNIDNNLEIIKHHLLFPEKLWSREEIIEKDCPIPASPGIYGWYFKNIPAIVPTQGCQVYKGFKLLYIGISPSSQASSQNLRKRIRFHMSGNAEGSTLRRTLGCILSEELGITLRSIGSRKISHFGKVGEDI
jgi:hypothetical protein